MIDESKIIRDANKIMTGDSLLFYLAGNIHFVYVHSINFNFIYDGDVQNRIYLQFNTPSLDVRGFSFKEVGLEKDSKLNRYASNTYLTFIDEN